MSQTLNESLRQRRKARGFTQEQLAERVHVSRQTISNWENGRANPDYEMLKTLADILEAPLTELLGVEEETAAQAEETPDLPKAAEEAQEPAQLAEIPAEPGSSQRFRWRMAVVFAAAVAVVLAVQGVIGWWQQRPVPSPYPPEWFMEEIPVQEEQAHIELGVLDSPVPLQKDMPEGCYRWDYPLYLRETNGVGFTIDRIATYHFYADGGHQVEEMSQDEIHSSRLGRHVTGNTVNYLTAGDGGITLILGRGYVLEATDENGNHVEARCYVPYEQPVEKAR